MMKYDATFIILHYGSQELTNRLINNINSFKSGFKVAIIIVDNYGNFDEMRSPGIFLIRTKKNEGFSHGNNLGFSYVKENIETELLFIANNDIYISNPDFLNCWFDLYGQDDFWIAGPDIIDDFGRHTSPLRYRPLNTDEVNERIDNIDEEIEILRYSSLLKLLKPWIIYNFVSKMKLYKWYKGLALKSDNICHIKTINSVLHGAFFVVDKKFIIENEKVFSPETFLYYEEDILSTRCLRNGWTGYYYPSISVFHEAHASVAKVKVSLKTYKENRIKNLINNRNSLSIFQKYLLLQM